MSVTEPHLVFLPLGGSGEIGMNLNLFGFGPEHDRKWIIVDIGVSFGDLSTPGVEIIMPDTEFIEGFQDDLLGIVLTHAHEDHMGALARLWPRLPQDRRWSLTACACCQQREAFGPSQQMALILGATRRFGSPGRSSIRQRPCGVDNIVIPDS